MIHDSELATIVGEEENDALDGATDIGRKRKYLMDSYNQQLYGDEVDGQSSVVTSDVADTVESILPSLMRVFAQGKQVGKFVANDPKADKEAEQKTLYSNWVFLQSNKGIPILHTLFKDALLQYTGMAKVWWDDSENVTYESYTGVRQEQLAQIENDEESTIVEQEEEDQPHSVPGLQVQPTFRVRVKRVTSIGKICIDTIPPDQQVIAKNARDYDKPRFIGQRTPKTRSELRQMGFAKDLVDSLSPDANTKDTGTQQARDYDLRNNQDQNPTTVKANDLIMLGEYYMYVDIDDDGISELWQIFYADNQILEKTEVDEHPYAVCVAIPTPHRAIGTCPAEQVADIQLVKTVLTRQMLNNAYHVNYSRNIVNERIDLDDLLNTTAGGYVRADGMGPIADSIQPLVVQKQIPELLQAIEYTDTARETRTGVTRFNQGLDADSLNQTATGFKGLMGASQNREQLMARMLADGIEVLYNKIISLSHKYQHDKTQVRVTGEVIEIDPTGWRYNMDAVVQVGLGSGDRQEKIANLNFIYQTQIAQMQQGLQLSDQTKLYATLEEIIREVGLRDVEIFFNNPEKPIETVIAQNEQLTQMVEQLEAQVQKNPLAEAELVKAKGSLVEAQGKFSIEGAKLRETIRKNTNDNKAKYTEMELKYSTDVPGEGMDDKQFQYDPFTGGFNASNKG